MLHHTRDRHCFISVAILTSRCNLRKRSLHGLVVTVSADILHDNSPLSSGYQDIIGSYHSLRVIIVVQMHSQSDFKGTKTRYSKFSPVSPTAMLISSCSISEIIYSSSFHIISCRRYLHL